MSIQEPAWLKRTRPCPFFSQGRCLFADSCNFLHDVKVRSALSQPLCGIVHANQSSFPPQPVFNPPSLVVDSASPRSDGLASPAHDSSRYSGLLSVLSDVIGPPSDSPTAAEDAVPPSSAVFTVPSSFPGTARDLTNLPPESGSLDLTSTIADMKTRQGASSRAEPSSILQPDSEGALIDPLGCRTEPEADSEPAAEFHPVLDNERFGDADVTPYLVEATEAYVIGSEAEEEAGDDEDMDDYGEEEPTVMFSNRQSTLSSFTGASLLASPRYSISGESPVSPVADSARDLLSPVQLSAKLRPFSISSLGSKIKRGDSIDSGYADGDSWVSPVPFPRSPPRSYRSSLSFLHHSRRTSLSSPAFGGRRVSYDVTALRPPRNPIEVIREVELDGVPEDNEDAACTILGAYAASPSEEQGDLGVTLQVNVAEEKVGEDDKPSEVPVVMRSPSRYSSERLCPTREYDLDLCNQPTFFSDDNLSFRTALSTQPSYENLSDISRVSPVKQDSLLSSLSASSTPNTSVLSHYDDANDLLGQSTIDSHTCESLYVVGEMENTEAPEAGASEECSLMGGVAVDPAASFTSVNASDVQGPIPEKTVAPRGSSVPTPSVETSHGPPSGRAVLPHVLLGTNDGREYTSGTVGTSQGRSSGIFHFDKQPPKSSPPSDSFRAPSVCDGSSDGHQEFGSENVTASEERSVDVLHRDRHSPPTDPHSLSPVGHSPVGTGDVQESFPRRRLSDVAQLHGHSPKQGPIPESSPASTVKDPSDSQGLVRMTSVPHLAQPSPSPCSFAQNTHSPSIVRDEYLQDVTDSGSSSSGSFPNNCLGGCTAAEVDQSLVEISLGSDEISDSFGSERDSFTQCLSFPLPPLFLPTELVGHSTLGGEEDTSILSEAVVGNVEGDEGNTSQDEVMSRTQLCSDLTQKAGPSQLPTVGSPNHSADFTLRRKRAASDLTVKAKSPPVIVHRETPDLLGPLPLPLEQPRSDSVQSLYDQYFDEDTFDDASESSGPMYKDMADPSVSGASEKYSQEDHPQSSDFTLQECRRASTSTSEGDPGSSGTDSLGSETVLRPLLTGRRSFLRSALAEIIPANVVNDKGFSSPSPLPTRLQSKEIGSTMVPLGFRRHKPQPVSTRSPQPLHTVLPASQLREMLRIRTDVARDDSPPGCSSATHVPSSTLSPLPEKAMSAPPTGGLRQLCLSSTINKRSSILSTHSSSVASSIVSLVQSFNSPIPQSPSVSSTTSFSHNSSFSSSCAQIPEHTHHTLKRSSSSSVIHQVNNDALFTSQSLARRDSRSVSAPLQQQKSWRLSHYRAGSRNYTLADGTRRISRSTSTLSLPYAVDEEREINDDDATVSRPIQSGYVDDWTCSASVLTAPVHAIATPKPNLLFAIASDDVDQVRQVLESGEAGPNDSVGPQSALAFTLTNDKLVRKQEIVKALLAYGANPAALQNPTLNPAPHIEGDDEHSGPPPETTLEGMDPATRYFVSRADAAHTRQTSQLIYRSFFRPLTRVRYDVIGQDWALEQLFRVLSIHSQKLAVAPIVVLLCGPSGHGKSLLARKFGSLLDVPTHTVNMTTLRSAHDIWQSHSMSPYGEPSSCTLAEFLIENEGERCVVVLDEIEKVEDQKALWSLLMPWELGRCSLEAGKRHIDARNVIWLGTSNIGHELVFEHHENRAEPDERMSREDYLELIAILRPRVSHCLGASLVSRVTTVLPFVPFTLDEKKAIAAEAVYALAGDASRTLSPQEVESLVTKALPSYHPGEGARSLHRAISNILVDTI